MDINICKYRHPYDLHYCIAVYILCLIVQAVCLDIYTVCLCVWTDYWFI